MCSRRGFLIGLFLFAQMGLLTRIFNDLHGERSGKFIRQGWVLQTGDV
jgi:hypothetical protein